MNQKTSKKNLILIAILTMAAVFTVTHIALALRPAPILMKWYHVDDAFYYFQVARNVAEGKGFTFDGLGTSNGFHPLWMLINIPVFALARFNEYLPLRVLLLVSAAITFLGGLLLFDLLRKIVRPGAALVGMAVWILYWPIQVIITLTGMEAGINAFSIVFFLWVISKFDRKRPLHMLLLGLAASVVLFSRLDNLFLILLAGAWLVFYQKPMRGLILVDILITFFTVFTSVILRVGAFESLAFLSSSYKFLVVALVIKLITYGIFGLYQWPRHYRPLILFIRTVGAVLVSSGVLMVVTLGLIRVNLIVNFPRSAILLDAGLTVVLLSASRGLLRLFTKEKARVPLKIREAGWSWLLRGTLYLMPVVILFGVYAFWNWRTFGTPMPVSGQIKQWWGTIYTIYGSHQKSIWTVLGIIPKSEHDIQPWYLLRHFLYDPVLDLFITDMMAQIPLYVTINSALTLIYGGLVFWLFQKKRSLLAGFFQKVSIAPLLAACLLQPFFLAAEGYLAIRSWYWIAQLVASLLFFVLLFDLLLTWLAEKPKVWRVAQYLPQGLVFVLIVLNIIRIHSYFPFSPSEKDIENYLSVTYFLEENTPPGSIIGLTGGGVEAYFIRDRTIVNLDGLINSKRYFDLMKAGEANTYLDEIGLDYVLSPAVRLFKTDPYQWYFTDRLGEIGQFKGSDFFVYLTGR